MASSTPFFTASKSWKSPTTSFAPKGMNFSWPLVFSPMDPHQSLKICRPMPPGQDVWSFQVILSPAAVAIEGAARVLAAATPIADFLRKSRLLVLKS